MPAWNLHREEGALFPTDCEPCAKGLETFAARAGSGACDPCPVGTFNENLGASECELCPARTYGLEQGADSRLRCDACPRWHFNSTPGSSKIQSCVYTFSVGARVASAEARKPVGVGARRVSRRASGDGWRQVSLTAFRVADEKRE